MNPSFSPGVRGWTEPRIDGVILGRRFPPACGGGPNTEIYAAAGPEFSPGVRGWTGDAAIGVFFRGVFPRLAGVDRNF